MNLRIQELKKQAMVEVRSHGAFGEVECYKTLDEDKFAELIVRECTNMLPEDSVRNANGVHMFYVIREHFGVSVIGR